MAARRSWAGVADLLRFLSWLLLCVASTIDGAKKCDHLDDKGCNANNAYYSSTIQEEHHGGMIIVEAAAAISAHPIVNLWASGVLRGGAHAEITLH
jgi:hypothetical protein